jgi:hypothetical protein
VKSYPSIPYCPRSGTRFALHTFDKIDGSNLRFEWSKKQGWYKTGTRTRLFDETDPVFGEARKLFLEGGTLSVPLAAHLEEIFRKQRWDRVIVFCEFWGERSFAGLHVPGDPKHLTVIDVNPHKKGLLPPAEFLKLFESVAPRYLGYQNWGPRFLETVALSELGGITFEGVVGKARGRGNTIAMFKYKTNRWREEVRSRFQPAEAEEIIKS